MGRDRPFLPLFWMSFLSKEAQTLIQVRQLTPRHVFPRTTARYLLRLPPAEHSGSSQETGNLLARKSELKAPSYFLAPAPHTASFTVFGISSLPLLLLPNELIWGGLGH
ncbi:CD109 antigen [Platysternon megacephalum]|uniref:CD109 antigen n=1 Tax=Platysternon megacephalum TaxID=55544 RepID=A0A4D9EWY3_9SAUR|nr:CD109 antigen [Platysternon megacephalum]